MSGIPAKSIPTAIDGCGAPIHYLPLRAMALAYARFTEPSMFEHARRDACARLARAMQEHPEQTNEPSWRGPCGRKLLTKGGAAGLYCGGAVGRGLGFAMKLADGARDPAKHIFIAAMERLGVLAADEAAAARGILTLLDVSNRCGDVVGRIEPCLPW